MARRAVFWHTETILWRVASGIILGTLVAYGGHHGIRVSLHTRIRRHFTRKIPEISQLEISRQEKEARRGRLSSKASPVAACIRNNSVSEDPALTAPLESHTAPIYCQSLLLSGSYTCFCCRYHSATFATIQRLLHGQLDRAYPALLKYIRRNKDMPLRKRCGSEGTRPIAY